VFPYLPKTCSIRRELWSIRILPNAAREIRPSRDSLRPIGARRPAGASGAVGFRETRPAGQSGTGGSACSIGSGASGAVGFRETRIGRAAARGELARMGTHARSAAAPADRRAAPQRGARPRTRAARRDLRCWSPRRAAAPGEVARTRAHTPSAAVRAADVDSTSVNSCSSPSALRRRRAPAAPPQP